MSVLVFCHAEIVTPGDRLPSCTVEGEGGEEIDGIVGGIFDRTLLVKDQDTDVGATQDVDPLMTPLGDQQLIHHRLIVEHIVVVGFQDTPVAVCFQHVDAAADGRVGRPKVAGFVITKSLHTGIIERVACDGRGQGTILRVMQFHEGILLKLKHALTPGGGKVVGRIGRIDRYGGDIGEAYATLLGYVAFVEVGPLAILIHHQRSGTVVAIGPSATTSHPEFPLLEGHEVAIVALGAVLQGHQLCGEWLHLVCFQLHANQSIRPCRYPVVARRIVAGDAVGGACRHFRLFV